MSSKNAQNQRIGIYPGTFDPVTNGHIEIIRRADKLVDKLIVAVAESTHKRAPLFSTKERVALVEKDIQPLIAVGHNIEVKSFDNLLIHFCQDIGAKVLIRGLRAVSDFDFEFQMAGLNAELDPDIETAFLMASGQNQFISSSFVRQICYHGGDISSFVSKNVVTATSDKYTDS